MTEQLSYQFHPWCKTQMDVVMTVILLMRTDDPCLQWVEADTSKWEKEQLAEAAANPEKAREWMDALKKAKKVVCSLQSEVLQEMQLQFVCGDSIQVFLKSNADLEKMQTFEEQLHDALIGMFPEQFDTYEDEAHQPFQATVNLKRGSIVLEKRLLLNQDTTYADFENSYFVDHQLKQSTRENVKLNRPVRFWNRDWICAMHFEQKLRVVNFRIVMPGENGIASYTDFDSDTEKKAFDQVIALLDREMQQKGSRQTLEGMVCYGYEKGNVMAVLDQQQHCVSLVFMMN